MSDYRFLRSVRVQARDGAALLTDLYLPADHKPCPVLLVRTPYGSLKPIHAALGLYLTRRGYALAVQNVRGRYGSEGGFLPFLHEADDAADTVSWLTAQPWFGGKLGLLGVSYGAYASLAPACSPPHGVSMAAIWIGGFADPCRLVYRNGVMQLHWALPASLMWTGATADLPRPVDWLEQWRHMAPPAGQPDGLWREWLSHPAPDDYWAKRQPPLPSAIPTLHLAGFQDFLLDSSLALYAASAAHRRLIIGPWDHSSILQALLANLRGEPCPAGAPDLAAEILRWLETWLHGHVAEPPAPGVTYHVKGCGWRHSASWPPAPAPERFHIGPADLESNPEHPLPTPGGAVWPFYPWLEPGHGELPPPGRLPGTYLAESPPLSAAGELVGEPRAHLWIEAREPVDCHVALVDVNPAGRRRLVTDGVSRTAGTGRQQVSVPLMPTAYQFGQGHRVGVLLSLSNFPRYPVVPHRVTAALLAGPDHASYVQLPWTLNP